jgi:hypothetical protein
MSNYFFGNCLRAALGALAQVFYFFVLHQQGRKTATAAHHCLTCVMESVHGIFPFISFAVEPDVLARFTGAFCFVYFLRLLLAHRHVVYPNDMRALTC